MAAVSFTRDIPTRSLLAGNVGHLTAYEHIQSVTVGSLGASSVTFSEIPQDYRHLQIRGVARSTRSATSDYMSLQLNGDTASNYAYHGLQGDGTSAISFGYATQSFIDVPRAGAATATSSVFGATVIDILDYSNTVKNKTVRTLGGSDNNGSGSVALESGLWMSTAAVNSLTLKAQAGSSSFVQYTTFSLYGIR